MRTDFYDAVVVGSGQAGKPLAEALASAGHRTAIIEMGRIGGTCIIDGCTPSKAMFASARIAHLAGRAADYGVSTGPVSVDMAAVRERKRGIVDAFSEAARSGLLDQRRLTLVHGEARFVDARALQIRPTDAAKPHVVEGDRIFLNVGARPRIPEIPGIPPERMLTSTTVMELGRLPARLLVLGGGAVGLEFAQMFRRFGSDVTVVERADRILAAEDPDVTDELTEILAEEGVRILTSAEVLRGSAEGGTVRLELDHDSRTRVVSGSDLLVAVGRIPNTEELGLAHAGITPDADGYIPVDDRCRTEAESVWAMGDVTGAPPFTHIAYDDYRVVAADVLDGRPARSRDRMLPYTIFTDPELGRVGLTERQARARGLSFKVARLPMRHVARAVESGEQRGFMKCLVENGSDRILGAAILAAQGGEIVSLLQFAMMGNLPYTAIRDGVIAHPTHAEGLQSLFLTTFRQFDRAEGRAGGSHEAAYPAASAPVTI